MYSIVTLLNAWEHLDSFVVEVGVEFGDGKGMEAILRTNSTYAVCSYSLEGSEAG